MFYRMHFLSYTDRIMYMVGVFFVWFFFVIFFSPLLLEAMVTWAVN